MADVDLAEIGGRPCGPGRNRQAPVLIRRGGERGVSERRFWVIGGDPLLAEIATLPGCTERLKSNYGAQAVRRGPAGCVGRFGLRSIAKPGDMDDIGHPSSVRPGAQATAKIDAKLEPGWHIYALTNPAGGPTPTSIKVTPANPAVAG